MTILDRAGNILSPQLQAELSESARHAYQQKVLAQYQNIDTDLDSFWTPVQTNMLSHQESKRVKSWITLSIFAIAALLILLFVLVIIPNEKAVSKTGNTVVVNGAERGEKETLAVKNIELEKTSDKEIAANSPLLSKERASVVEYKIESGDNIESIARKFYGNSNYDTVQKIKIANNVKNSRLLQIGQKLIIPF